MAKTATERKSCGTRAGYYWHRNHGEDPCEACRTGALMAWSAKHMAGLLDPQTGLWFAAKGRAMFFEEMVEVTV